MLWFRRWFVASAALVIAIVLVSWPEWQSTPSGSTPRLNPPTISRPVAAELPAVRNPFGAAAALPKEIPGDTFSKMIAEFSEPDGYFMYENYVSNERSYQDPIPSMLKVVKRGGAYLGVGPEQNFTYIAAIRPAIAFIVDIRRQNMVELLMYKALFGMASTRREFVSLLFSRTVPALHAERKRDSAQPQENENASVDDLFRTASDARPDSAFFESNLKRIKGEVSISREDQKTLEDVYRVFFSVGPELNYKSTDSYAPAGPSYEQLVRLTDVNGRNWNYLASEENFRFVKEMQRKNLIIPLVGSFAGPKTIRSVAAYLKDHQATVSAFYLSNVEMYILPAPQWKRFSSNVAELPVDESSMFIRFLLGSYSRALLPDGSGPRNASVIGPMIDVLTGVRKGYPLSYTDLIHASR